jgi:uncharacterized repeat protein (TIGR01451 family)
MFFAARRRRPASGIGLVLAAVVLISGLPVTGSAAARIEGDVNRRSNAPAARAASAGKVLSAARPQGLVTNAVGNMTPTDLANAILGGGVSVSNVVYKGTSLSAGTFSGGAGIIGFENGIVLSSGRVSNVVGPNQGDSTGSVNDGAGDNDLSALIGGTETFDATVLEFDFVPSSDLLTFQYVFSSEEYNEFVGEFNDVFGLLVNGQNVALVPGTVTPVSINNVNGGDPFGTNPKNPHLYRNNDLDDGGGQINTEMDGLTVVLLAQASVTPGQVNHLKLAVADAGDESYDSSVFIKGSSLTSQPPADLSIAITGAPDVTPTGSQITYTLTATNNGPNPATGVTVTDTLPAGVTLVSATGGCTPSGGTVVCDLGGLASGASASRDIFVLVNAASGVLNNTASVAGNEPDPNTANNTATKSTAVDVAFAISGRVADAANNGISGATVSMGGTLTGSVTTDSQGNYTFAGLKPGGNYIITPSKAGFVFTPPSLWINNLSANHTANFTAGPATGIFGRVTQQETQAGIPDVFVTLSGTMTRVVKTDAQGNYSFAGLAGGGDYTVTPQSPLYGFAPLRREFISLSDTGPNTADFVTSRNTPPTLFQPPTDDFSGGARDPNKWNLGTLAQPPGGFSPAVSVAQAAGSLVITPTTTVGYNGYVSVNSFDLTNGAAGVQLVQAGAGGTETAFAVGQDSDNFFRFVVRPNQTQTPDGKRQSALRWLAADDLVLRFQVKVGGQVTEASIPYDPAAHRYLRFRHDAAQNSINFETSPDNAAWTARRSFGPLSKGASALACELSAGTSAQNAAPGQAVFDNFNLTTSTVQFKVAAERAAETSGQIVIVVRRHGSTAGAASVTYQTAADTAAAGSDFQAAQGTLQFAPGEVEKTFTVQLADDSLIEGDEAFDVILATATSAGLDSPARHRVTIADNESSIADARFFARQHYLDFFNREPDQAGWDFWTNQITECGTNQGCTEVRRINASAAFFVSIEFQETGYLIYKTYGAALGTRRVGQRVPLTLQEFLPDLQQIGAGVVVGQGDWQQKLAANKSAFFSSFVQRQVFTALYPAGMTPRQFVEALRQNTGAALSQTEFDALVNQVAAGGNTSAARAQALRVVAEDTDFDRAEYNRAFVLMQYFGYLRRNPNDAPEPTRDFAGYDFWLGKLNEFNGNYVAAEMVKGFITSAEYTQRFGQ